MKVKVCGLREPENIAEVRGLGVEYLGLIFHPDSPRFAGQSSLAEYLRAHKSSFDSVQLVGVFVNAEIDYILNTVHDFGLDWVQLHGNESAGYCQELKLLWSVNTLRKASICKAFSITDEFDFRVTNEYVPSASMFVFDTGGGKQAGGTGRKWNWKMLADYQGPVPFLLSGGIGPTDAAAIRQLDHPQMRGVDLNSRFETEAGLKDVESLQSFISRLT